MSVISIAPPGNSRQRRKLETRRSLLAAAEHLFCASGYAETSVDAIAARAGFTKGALYGLFESKEGLFLALTNEQTDSLVTELSDVVGTERSADEITASVSEWLAETAVKRRDWCLVNAEFALHAARRPDLAEKYREMVNRSCARVAGLLMSLPHVAAGPEEEVARTSRLVVALMNGLVLHAALDPGVDLAGDFGAGIRSFASVGAIGDPERAR